MNGAVACGMSDIGMHGYEIHMGATAIADDASAVPLAALDDGSADGCFVDGKCMGTYLHGILDNAAFVDFVLAPHASKTERTERPFDYEAFKNGQYDLLADHVRRNVDMDKVYGILKGKYNAD